MRPDGYGNISRQYNFRRLGSSVTRNCFVSSQVRCHLASISRNGYRSLDIIGLEFYIVSWQEQQSGRGRGVEPDPLPRDYFFTPSSSRASFACFTESACLPSLWSASALSSMDTAFFTLSLVASIFAAASRPCLTSVGHMFAVAVPAVSVRPTTTAVTAMSVFIRVSPPRVPGWLHHSNRPLHAQVPWILAGESDRRCAARAAASPWGPPRARPPTIRARAGPSRGS